MGDPCIDGMIILMKTSNKQGAREWTGQSPMTGARGQNNEPSGCYLVNDAFDPWN